VESLDETEGKIGEAEYFLKKVQELEKHGDNKEFEYNLNAFLHSWASIFDIMLEDYQRFYGLKISILDDLNIHTFKDRSEGNENALEFIYTYDKKMLEFFGYRNHKRVLKLLESPIRVDEFVAFLLSQMDWDNPQYGYHDCYIALYNVIQDILGWNLDYHKLIMQPAVMSRQKLGFDRGFVQELFSHGNFEGLNMNLDQVFEQDFLRQKVKQKQERRFSHDQEHLQEILKSINELTVQTPIFTIAGLIKKKRHSKTHRKGSELMSTIETFQGDKLISKSRLMNFLKEDYASEEQGMIFGHFNTPLYTVETCEQMLEKAKEFVNLFSKKFPIT